MKRKKLEREGKIEASGPDSRRCRIADIFRHDDYEISFPLIHEQNQNTKENYFKRLGEYKHCEILLANDRGLFAIFAGSED